MPCGNASGHTIWLVPTDETFFDRAIFGFVRSAPWWLVAGTPVLLYAGGGVALPLALRWSTLELVAANVVCTVMAFVVVVAWFIVQAEAADRRHLVEWTTELRNLDSTAFEWLVGELFRREGWKVKETGRPDAPDGNIDLELNRAGERKIVQCKRWESWPVGVNEVRGFAGTLMRERLRASAGIFVTLSKFTEDARSEAKRTGLALVDGRELYARVEKARRAEPCPSCAKPMVLAHSASGWWLRCNARGCMGKRDLSSQPGWAVDLLLERP